MRTLRTALDLLGAMSESALDKASFAQLGCERAAWFSDTEGNILCVHEDVK